MELQKKMKHIFLFTALWTVSALTASAQNPIIRNQFTADPTARVFNNRMYVYPSHDILSPVEPEKKWFCMEDYHVFSSENLTDWTDHGVIITQNKVPWVKRDSYAMWAPECVEKNGQYYFYFPSAPKSEEKGFGVGVAISKNPEGPFFPMWQPIEGIHGIDPCVLIDPKDGKSYIYWAGMGMWMARLKDNMMELDSKPEPVKGLPEGFKEGPFVFERQGRYYYTFPWVRDSTETLAYAMGDSPMGPFEFKGVIMDESPVACWTNHHSIVEYRGQWYLFYHHNDYSPEFDKLRSIRADYLSFNPDGTIQKVTPTLRGVGITKACERIDIDRYSKLLENATIDFLDRKSPFLGWKTLFKKKGDGVVYERVDFGNDGVTEVVVRAKAASSGKIVVESEGKRIAVISIPKSSSWQDFRTSVLSSPKGINDIKVWLMNGSRIEIDNIGFDMLPWQEGAFTSKKYRNMFQELGYSEKAIDEKLQEAFNGLFYGPEKVYFEVGDSMAYISDIKNHDVRTEGMSYGMMIAVQWDKKEIFDRLWRWAKKYMQHQEGQRKGYFRWSLTTDGKPNAQGAASDGELYFVTSLLFASNRWGNTTGIDYLSEAQKILDLSMQKTGMSEASPLVNIEHKLITFTPDPMGGAFTDPSYHIPAFYEVWAKYAKDGRKQFWLDCAKASREYLHRSVHPVTGLNPDYNNYDGSLLKRGGVLGDAFRYDSWRVPMNIAMDYSWSCSDREWQQEYANRIQNFLYSQGIDTFLDQYNIDGTEPEEILEAGGYKKRRHSVGFVATAAAASLAATHTKSREFVERLWNSRHEPYEDGYFDAYYDGLIRLFALMHLSGRYRIIE